MKIVNKVYKKIVKKIIKIIPDLWAEVLVRDLLQFHKVPSYFYQRTIIYDSGKLPLRMVEYANDMHMLSKSYKNNQQPLLSICISTYNRSAWLIYTLEHLVNECSGFMNIVEIVVCDNASTDNTKETIENFDKRDLIKYHRNKVNVGMLGNLGVTAGLASGKYVWIIGDDDVIMPGGIPYVLSRINNFTNAELFYVNYAISWVGNPREISREDYFQTQIPIAPESDDIYVDSIRAISAKNENFFTAIYCCIFRRDHAVRAYTQDISGRPFSSLATCVPTTKYVVENLMDSPGYWIGEPIILINPNVSWTQHLNLWFTNIQPEIFYQFEIKNVPNFEIDNFRRNRISDTVKYIKKSVEESSPNLEIINLDRLFETYSHLDEFKVIVKDLYCFLVENIEKFPNVSISTLQRLQLEGEKKRVAVISTYNSKCGIATYASNLTREISKKWNYKIFANYDIDKYLDECEEAQVVRCWSAQNTEDLSLMLEKYRHDLLIIQWHPAFYYLDLLFEVLEKANIKNTKVIIILHNVTAFLPGVHGQLFELVKSGNINFIVHNLRDRNRIVEAGVPIENSIYCPHGIVDITNQIPKKVRASKDFIISSSGFLLEHKGIKELIISFYHVNKVKPETKLKLYTSILDWRSELYLQECIKLINELKISEIVQINTDFIDENELIKKLSEVDLIIFPYKNSDESASGAVRMGLSSTAPVMCTKIPIFDELSDVVYFINPKNINNFSKDIISYIESNEGDILYDKRIKYINKYSWKEVLANMNIKL
jgi:glycosyltransferase involved in cell wall biosynthesis